MGTPRDNFGFKHKCGILMPISSLPSPYGIGNFGKAAYDFIDFLSETSQKVWQVLPLNPTSYGDSPYQSPASVAGNPYFIDPDQLVKVGLLTSNEAKENQNSSDRVDYGWLFNTRYVLLRKAYARFNKDQDLYKEYTCFVRKNKEWIEDYALFMALKVSHNYCAWYTWPEEHKDCEQARKLAKEYAEECGFWKWVQFEFFRQWQALVDYAHSHKIVIVGDMPIYVAHDSMDVWRAPEQFLLDENYNPTCVAGCPPDGFSPDGQLWGNPIYNWELMEEQDFSWWCDRVKYAFKMYDILRIEHFRGFAGYYHIPFGDENARRGEWASAPGIKLFRTIKDKYPKAKIIAEDLGFITEDVRALLDDTGFPGMKVLQFAFFDDNSEYLPKTYPHSNSVVYTGSHDSDCTKSWASQLTGDVLARFKRECPRKKGQSATYATIQLALSSKSNLAVIPLQDYLQLTNEQGRMNVPSVAQGNWTWRVSPRYNTKALRDKILDLVKETKR